MNTPIIRFEVEGMKHTVMLMLQNYAEKMDSEIKEAIEKSLTPENILAEIEKVAKAEIKTAINTEIEAFYRWGKGRDAIKEAVKKMLADREAQ